LGLRRRSRRLLAVLAAFVVLMGAAFSLRNYPPVHRVLASVWHAVRPAKPAAPLGRDNPGLDLLSAIPTTILADHRADFVNRSLGSTYLSACFSAQVRLDRSGSGTDRPLLRLRTFAGDPVAKAGVLADGHLYLSDGAELSPSGPVMPLGKASSVELCREMSGVLRLYAGGVPALGPWAPESLTGISGIGSVGLGDPSPRASSSVPATFADVRVDDHPGTTDERPLLEDLTIGGAGVQSRPAFVPNIFRYAVYPDAATGSIVVTPVTTDPSDRITVDGRTTQSGMGVTLSSPDAGDRIEVAVEDAAGQMAEYQLVYLPAGFPVMDVSLLDPARAAPGFLYVTANQLQDRACDPAAPSCFAIILDGFGVAVSYWQDPHATYDLKLQPGGLRSYLSLLSVDRDGNPHAEVVTIDANGQEAGRYQAPGLPNTNHHDFLIRPNGDRVFLSYITTERPLGELNAGAPVRVTDGIVEEVDPQGRVVFTYSTAGQDALGDPPGQAPDYFHINSVFIEPDGDFLLSARRTSQVFEVDGVTGKVNWRLGGTDSDFRIAGDPIGAFCGQHTVTMLPDGNILMFDNGQNRASASPTGQIACPQAAIEAGRGRVSRAAEYHLNTETRIARLVWSYEQGPFAPSEGSAQRLDNGNTLIGWGVSDSGLIGTEVDPDGQKVFELSGTWPDGIAVESYRVYRFPE